MKRRELLATAALVAAVAAGCGTTARHAPPQAARVESHTITGTLDLHDSPSARGDQGAPCEGTGGYADITGGAPVTVTDQAGTVIATGALNPGAVTDPHLVCQFGFAVPDVPPAAFYGVEISHRGKITESAARLARDGWAVHFTLG